MLCGASAVQIGTANFINPMTAPIIVEGLKKYVEKNKLNSISEIKGKLIID
jgi:dihydroorotate dehydrogenase (NAD+) catalytic subunit